MRTLSSSLQLFTALVVFFASWTSALAVSFPGVPAPPRLNASSFILVDFDTGTVQPASLTKIMTSSVVAEALASGAVGIDDKTTVSEKAWRMGGSKMFIEVNKRVTVNELLQGIIVQSGNDASVAIAEYISGSEDVFSAVMNQYSSAMGLENTSFANSTGLPDPGTFTTAADMAELAVRFIRDYPEIYQRFSEQAYTYAGIKQPNRNRLLARDPSVDGFKTGHTEAAGYCLVSSAKRGDMRLIAVVMGAESDKARTEASQALLNYGFRFFETRKVYSQQETVASVKVWKGAADTVDVGVKSDLHVTIPRTKFSDVSAAAEFTETISAPVSVGQPVGQLVLKLEDDILLSIPLVAKNAVEKGSIFSRALDAVMMRIE
jgi:D-alanyl-D-alanine carboxypeptidase (penicillin-binding protein 5/6)